MGNLHLLFTLLVAQALIAMSPGLNTVMVLKNAFHGKKYGIATAAGIWPVGIFWASIGFAGIGTLLIEVPSFILLLHVACGGYLLWLGYRAIRHSFHKADLIIHESATAPSLASAFRSGVISNFANPKTIAYWASIFTAAGASKMPLAYGMAAVIAMPSVSFVWYSSLSVLVSRASIRQSLGKVWHWLDRIAGIVMLGFGVQLLISIKG